MIRNLLAVFLLCVSFFSEAQTQYAWTQKAGFPAPARHRCVGATIGSRCYLGQGHVNAVSNVLYDDWWEYDPGTDSWAQKASFPGGPRYHGVAFTIGNYAYAGTGRDFSGNTFSDIWRYDPVNNSWSAMAPCPGAVRGAVAFAINGKGYIATGSYTTGLYEYDPVQNLWTTKAPLPGAGRTSAVAFTINGKGYVATGDIGGPSADLWEYNPATNSWTSKASLPGLPRMEACGFALNGYGFVGTGDNFSSGDNYDDFWAYNPSTNAWVQVAYFAGAARRYMTAMVIGNRAYAGAGTSGINYSDFWEYGMLSDVPSQETVAPQLSIAPNPCTDQTVITCSSLPDHAVITVDDLTGRTLRRWETTGDERIDFDRSGLNSGLYFVSIRKEETLIAQQKLVIH
jgi:N-acetylneuraminic acid mutarotase